MSKPYLIIHITDDGSIGKIWERPDFHELRHFVIEKAKEMFNMSEEEIDEILDDAGTTISKDGYIERLEIAQTEDE